MSDDLSEKKDLGAGSEIEFLDFDEYGEDIDASADADTPSVFDEEEPEDLNDEEGKDEVFHAKDGADEAVLKSSRYEKTREDSYEEETSNPYMSRLESDMSDSALKNRSKTRRLRRRARRGDSIEPIETQDGIISIERRKTPRKKKNKEDDLRHPDYILTLTKGLTNVTVKRLYLPYRRVYLIAIAVFLVFAALITYIAFSATSMLTAGSRRSDLKEQLSEMTQERDTLVTKNNALSEKVSQLSQSLNSSVSDSVAEAAEYEDSLMPNGFPLSTFFPMEITYEGAENVQAVVDFRAQQAADENANEDGDDDANQDGLDDAASDDGASSDGSSGDDTSNGAADKENASAQDDTQEDPAGEDGENSDNDGTPEVTAPDALPGHPLALFSCTEGTNVLASGGGVVTRIIEDEVFGTMILIDHRNGYTSVYRTDAEALINVGDAVKRGDSIFELTHESTWFGYQIMLNDSYINPAAMLEING